MGAHLCDRCAGSQCTASRNMEKNEKIQASRTKKLRAIATLFFIGILSASVFLVLNQQPRDDGDSSSDEKVAATADQASLGAQPAKTYESEEVLVKKVAELDARVREIKATGVLMEVDPKGLEASKALQTATRELLAVRYGTREPYRVRLDLKFQESNPTFKTDGEDDNFTIEMAPSSLQPHSIFSFLEVARHWPEKKGAFHRRANHVLQAMVKGNRVKHLAFQEYSPEFPHVKGTVGYAGRPSGPAFYVSIMDNSRNHGPGSQQKKNPYEADSCFGKVVEGFEDVVLKRITKMPGSGFLEKPMHVLIDKMTILVPDDNGDYVEWQKQ